MCTQCTNVPIVRTRQTTVILPIRLTMTMYNCISYLITSYNNSKQQNVVTHYIIPGQTSRNEWLKVNRYLPIYTHMNRKYYSVFEKLKSYNVYLNCVRSLYKCKYLNRVPSQKFITAQYY